MKKLFFISILITFASCTEEFLDNSLTSIVTDADIEALAAESPEQLLTVATSFDVGTVNNMRTFDVTGDGGHFDYGQKSVDLAMDLMANDMINAGNGWWYDGYYDFTGRIQSERETGVIWNYYYTIIRGANQTISLIGGLDESQLTADLGYVLARAKVVRSLSYLQLIQIYQKGNPDLSDAGVPIIDPTADLINGDGFGRLTVGDVYTQIETDLVDGYNGLVDYTRGDKTAVNSYVTAGLLARYYLLTKDYTNASKYAKIAQGGATLDGSSILDGFQFISNSEWLWGAVLDADTSSIYASFFAHVQAYSAPYLDAGNTQTPGYTGQLGHHKTVDERLYNQIPDTDTRKNWFGPDNGFIYLPEETAIYNYKFYDDTFFEADYVYMRVAEMYLIEAEAEASNGNSSNAAQALYNLVSTRDASYSLSTSSGDTLLEEIKVQRRIELWGEGFGMLDLKRWGDPINRVYTNSSHPVIGASYIDVEADSNLFTLQIPETEINSNDAINSEDQNP